MKIVACKDRMIEKKKRKKGRVGKNEKKNNNKKSPYESYCGILSLIFFNFESADTIFCDLC